MSKLFGQISLAIFATLILSACDVDQTQEGRLPSVDVDADAGQVPKYDVVKTQEGKLPDVDVDVSGGQMPKFDVDVVVPDVDVQTKTMTAEVPDIDVKTKEVEIEVPSGIEIRLNGEDGNDRVND